MMESVPSIAPRSPPETGASSISTSCAASRSAIARVGPGSIVLMSITSEPAAAPASHAVVAEQHVLDVGRVGQHRDDDVGRRARPPPAMTARSAPASHELVDRSRAPRMHGQREPGGEQVARHGRAHDAEPDEPDPLAHAAGYASTPASAISSARSMISNPSAICSSVMGSGGFVISVHQWIIV